jgi:hypothetical protein
MQDDNTNLPILDDIIKPGDADKAVNRPSSKVHSSLLSDDETNGASTAGGYAETSLDTEYDDQPDSVELDTDNQINIDAISEEILGKLMHEIEQLLRDKIQQTLRQHFPGETRPA